MAFAFANGPLACAVITWRNSVLDRVRARELRVRELRVRVRVRRNSVLDRPSLPPIRRIPASFS